MTLKRQYTLPNCSLTVDGLSTGDDTDLTAPLTVVLNSECRFPELSETLTGGREFLDALVKTVSTYVQSVLSGVVFPEIATPDESQPIVLKQIENQRHQLTATLADDTGTAVNKTLMLTTVQLFDLMEVVDQLLADPQTLPDMTLQLSPLQRRYVRATEPVAKRVVPAAAGISALAASAALLFVMPTPILEPEPAQEEVTTDSDGADPTAAEPGAAGAEPPAEGGQAAVPDAIDDGGSPQTDSTDSDDDLSPLTNLESAASITDPDELEQLATQLEETLASELPASPNFDEELRYRVTVSQQGDILGYSFANDAALADADNTPLPDLTFNPLETGQEPEAVAQFLVTFDPEGEVMAEPIGTEE